MGFLTTRADAEAEALIEAQLQELTLALTRSSETSERLASGIGTIANHVLEAGTKTYDAVATPIGFSFGATCGSLLIRNTGNTVITVAAGQGPGVRPVQGPGVHYVEGRSWRTMPINARTFTVYGAATSSFGYEAYTNLVQPAAGMLGDLVSTGAVTLGTDPAAGSEASVTVPAGENWVLSSALATLVTDATVANRTVHLVIDDGTNVIGNYTAAAAQTASTTVAYSWTGGGPDATAVRDGVAYSGQLPVGLRLLPGWRVRTLTSSLQAGDNWSALAVTYQRTAQ